MREAVASAATSQRRARRRLPQEQEECAAWADGASYKKGRALSGAALVKSQTPNPRSQTPDRLPNSGVGFWDLGFGICPASVPIMLRLVRSLDRHAEVLRLLLRQLRQLDAEVIE